MLLVEVVTVICDVSSINSKFESGTRKKSIGNGNEKQFILFRNRNTGSQSFFVFRRTVAAMKNENTDFHSHFKFQMP